MLLRLHVEEKSIGTTSLLSHCTLELTARRKVGILGRNGTGKSTLLRLLSGDDDQFYGTRQTKPNLNLLMTAQEHEDVADWTVFAYLLAAVPEYTPLKLRMQHFEANPSPTLDEASVYIADEERFRDQGFYQLESKAEEYLEAFGLPAKKYAIATIASLSGGQRRFVELCRCMLSGAEVLLLDEPTNHMDSYAKIRFMDWFANTDASVCMVSHDRDVLELVDEIYELRENRLVRFIGGYSQYLLQNANRTLSEVQEWEQGQNKLARLKGQLQTAHNRKQAAKSDKGRDQAKTKELQITRSIKSLSQGLEKPVFWIDQETLAAVSPTVLEGYEKYKAKNIHIATSKERDEEVTLLILRKVSAGWNDTLLFEPVDLKLKFGDRVRLLGRNGAGKSTLLKAIRGAYEEVWVPNLHTAGTVQLHDDVRIGFYSQETPVNLFDLPLRDAIEQIYLEEEIPITTTQVNSLLGSYLFNPLVDGHALVRNLSGGQRARLQIIRMLANEPNLLILDEPTNHLDLPSIEELERALTSFGGALIYVSHDTHFAARVPAFEIEIR